MEHIAERIGAQIKKFRKQKGLTQACLAEKSDISTDFISRVERGVNIASVQTLNSICTALDIEISYLLSIHDNYEDRAQMVVIQDLLKRCDDYTLSKITSVITTIVTILDDDFTYPQTKTN